MDLYQIITDKIIDKLEAGTIPWMQPWQDAAVNWVTQKSYRGINQLLLKPGEYATFNQIKKAGGRVKKGEKSELIIFWKLIEIEDEDKMIPLMRYYRVFKVGEQTEGLETKRKKNKHNPIEEAEQVFKGYQEPTYKEWGVGAYYNPKDDIVNVPPREDFISIHAYYSTLFHEMVHSTGHKERLNRDGITGAIMHGSEKYCKEELIAEIGASFLCGHTGIENYTLDESAAYIDFWLKALKEDKKIIVSSSQQAQKAVDYILGIEWKS